MIKKKITLYLYQIHTNGGPLITVRSLRQLTGNMLKRKAEERGLDFSGFSMAVTTGTYAMPLDFFIENATCMD